MQIIKYPNPILLRKSIEVLPESARKLAQDMMIFMESLPWGSPVGLAAPQIGENVRVFIALGNVYINPVMEPLVEEGVRECKEGCYSLEENKFDYEISRYNAVRLKWINKKGEKKELVFRGFPAQVIQHEYDHLEGRLCCGDLR